MADEKVRGISDKFTDLKIQDSTQNSVRPLKEESRKPENPNKNNIISKTEFPKRYPGTIVDKEPIPAAPKPAKPPENNVIITTYLQEIVRRRFGNEFQFPSPLPPPPEQHPWPHDEAKYENMGIPKDRSYYCYPHSRSGGIRYSAPSSRGRADARPAGIGRGTLPPKLYGGRRKRHGFILKIATLEDFIKYSY